MFALKDGTKRPKEDEVEYYIRLTDASNRCGNVHTIEEQVTMFIEDIDPSCKTFIAKYRQDHPDISFIRLVNHAKLY